MCVFGGAGFGRGDPQESWVNKIIMTTLMDTMGKVKKKKKGLLGVGMDTLHTHTLGIDNMKNRGTK